MSVNGLNYLKLLQEDISKPSPEGGCGEEDALTMGNSALSWMESLVLVFRRQFLWLITSKCTSYFNSDWMLVSLGLKVKSDQVHAALIVVPFNTLAGQSETERRKDKERGKRKKCSDVEREKQKELEEVREKQHGILRGKKVRLHKVAGVD